MDWINLHTSFLDSPDFLGAEPVDRATWLCLLRYCVGQENSGRIESAASWGDRKWQQLVRVTAKEIRRTTELWTWDGEALVVQAYPIERQVEVQQKRVIAKLNGTKGGRPKKPRLQTQAEPTSVYSVKAEGEGEGEGEGEVEVEVREPLPPPPAGHDQITDDPIPARVVKGNTLGDLQAVQPSLLVMREDRERAETTLRLYGFAACTRVLTDLAHAAIKRPQGKRRVLVSEWAEAMAAKFELDPEDYQRAGLPAPEAHRA